MELDDVEQFFTEYGREPRRELWAMIDKMLNAPGAILEIGPGLGHLLAAAKEAGRDVCGVETNPFHRSALTKAWGITDHHDSLDALPSDRRFAGVLMTNVLEHIYDPAIFVKRLSNLLQPGGGVFISTVNARSMSATLLGTQWSMFKPEDHVSFPSARGLRTLATQTGLKAERIWTSELPLETPAAIAIALRDWKRERHATPATPSAATPKPASSPSAAPAVRRDRKFYLTLVKFGRLDPLSKLIGAMGKGASIKALVRKPA